MPLPPTNPEIPPPATKLKESTRSGFRIAPKCLGFCVRLRFVFGLGQPTRSTNTSTVCRRLVPSLLPSDLHGRYGTQQPRTQQTQIDAWRVKSRESPPSWTFAHQGEATHLRQANKQASTARHKRHNLHGGSAVRKNLRQQVSHTIKNTKFPTQVFANALSNSEQHD